MKKFHGNSELDSKKLSVRPFVSNCAQLDDFFGSVYIGDSGVWWLPKSARTHAVPPPSPCVVLATQFQGVAMAIADLRLVLSKLRTARACVVTDDRSGDWCIIARSDPDLSPLERTLVRAHFWTVKYLLSDSVQPAKCCDLVGSCDAESAREIQDCAYGALRKPGEERFFCPRIMRLSAENHPNAD